MVSVRNTLQRKQLGFESLGGASREVDKRLDRRLALSPARRWHYLLVINWLRKLGSSGVEESSRGPDLLLGFDLKELVVFIVQLLNAGLLTNEHDSRTTFAAHRVSDHRSNALAWS